MKVGSVNMLGRIKIIRNIFIFLWILFIGLAFWSPVFKKECEIIMWIFYGFTFFFVYLHRYFNAKSKSNSNSNSNEN